MSEVTITQATHPRLAHAFSVNAGFTVDLNNPDSFITVNGGRMLTARWNMICSKRDLTMWVKCKMKPHAGWAVTPVKKYFGLKGHGQALLNDFMALEAEVKSLMG